MKTEYMREFITFARYLNFTHAAKALYVTQPVLGYHISAMEKELGFSLINRGKVITLTPAGKDFLSTTEKLLGEYDAMLDRCAKFSRVFLGTVRFEQPYVAGFIMGMIRELVNDVQKECPDISVEMVVSHSSRLADALLSGQVDIGFSYEFRQTFEGLSGTSGAFTYVPLPIAECNRPCFWVRRDDPLANKDEITIDDLSGYSIVLPVSIRVEAFEERLREAIATSQAELRIVHYDLDMNDATAVFIHKAVEALEVQQVIMWDNADASETILQSLPNHKLLGYSGNEWDTLPYLVYRTGNENPALARLLEYLMRRNPDL